MPQLREFHSRFESRGNYIGHVRVEPGCCLTGSFRQKEYRTCCFPCQERKCSRTSRALSVIPQIPGQDPPSTHVQMVLPHSLCLLDPPSFWRIRVPCLHPGGKTCAGRHRSRACGCNHVFQNLNPDSNPAIEKRCSPIKRGYLFPDNPLKNLVGHEGFGPSTS